MLCNIITIMIKYTPIFLLATLVFMPLLATDTLMVKETKIPILIEREDNVLFYLRIDAVESKMLNELKFKFSDM